MECALERNDGRPAGYIAGQFDRALHRLRSTIGEEDLFQAFGCDQRQPLGQLDHGLVVGDHRDVYESVDLSVGGTQDFGMPVAQVSDSDAASEVEVAPAIDRVEVGT